MSKPFSSILLSKPNFKFSNSSILYDPLSPNNITSCTNRLNNSRRVNDTISNNTSTLSDNYFTTKDDYKTYRIQDIFRKYPCVNLIVFFVLLIIVGLVVKELSIVSYTRYTAPVQPDGYKVQYHQYTPIVWVQGDNYVKNIGTNILSNLDTIVRLQNKIESGTLEEGVKRTHPAVYQEAMEFVKSRLQYKNLELKNGYYQRIGYED